MDPRLYIFGLVLVMFFVFGCVDHTENQVSDNYSSSDDSDSSQTIPGDNGTSKNQDDQNGKDLQPPVPSKAPDEELLYAEPDYSSQNLDLVPTQKIDKVYILDWETYSEPRGRALVAGNSYEIIAENSEPFVEYVRFTVYADNQDIGSKDATCPEFCANETKYSVPLFMPEEEYKEIKIVAEDGSGLKGESVVYQYASSESYASYLAETCTLETDSIQPKSVEVDMDELVYYGSTISAGWLHNANSVPYSLNSNYHGLCNEVTFGGLGNGFFAQARCRFSYNLVSSFEPVPNLEACTCSCTANVSELTLNAAINIDFPDWTNYNLGTQCEKDHWDQFLQNLKIHEEGHASRDMDTKNNIEPIMRSLTGQATAANCSLACDTAFNTLKTNLRNALVSGVNTLNQEQERYDNDTRHGVTQGAVLNCGDC